MTSVPSNKAWPPNPGTGPPLDTPLAGFRPLDAASMIAPAISGLMSLPPSAMVLACMTTRMLMGAWGLTTSCWLNDMTMGKMPPERQPSPSWRKRQKACAICNWSMYPTLIK